jgi:hypothetical protein
MYRNAHCVCEAAIVPTAGAQANCSLNTLTMKLVERHLLRLGFLRYEIEKNSLIAK